MDMANCKLLKGWGYGALLLLLIAFNTPLHALYALLLAFTLICKAACGVE